MPAGILLLPFLGVRFLLLSCLSGTALRRAARFAPMQGAEKIAYIVYQLSNLGIFLLLIFSTVPLAPSWSLFLGLLCYLCGLALCAAAVINFASPDRSGLNTAGLYRSPTLCAFLAWRCWRGPCRCWGQFWSFKSPPTGLFWRRSAGVPQPLVQPTGTTCSASAAIFRQRIPQHARERKKGAGRQKILLSTLPFLLTV